MSNFAFTETEKDIILLGSSQIIRTENGKTTIYSFNNFGDNSYKYNIIKERMTNGGELNILSLFNNNLNTLQNVYPAIYNSYTSTPTSQTVNVITSFSIA